MKENIGRLAIYQGKICRIIDADEYFKAYKIRRKNWQGKITESWHDWCYVDEIEQEETKGLQIGDPATK